jgi:tRNA G26 N,N-dimethylase Trm1
MKRVAAKEIGIRILLARIHNLALLMGKGIEPLLCYSEGHHLRAFIRVTTKNNVSLKWISPQMEIINEEVKGAAGPLWTEKIIQNKLIPENCEGLLGRFFSTLKEESDGPPGLYDINDMAKEADIGQTPRRVKIVKILQDLGYFASSSVFSPLGIKTTAPKMKRNEALERAQSL